MTLGPRKIVAMAVAAIATVGIAAGAVAATSGSSDEAGDLAAAINTRAGTSISAADVTGAFQDVMKTRLDEAVAAGRITQAQADEMLTRAKNAPGLPFLGGPGHRGRGPEGPHTDLVAPVAKTLKLTEAQLRTKLRAGSTLAAIAKDQGVSRADLIASISTVLKADGVPAARIAEIAAHIADETRPPHGPRRERHGPGREGYGPRP